jgi:hypothetical protein
VRFMIETAELEKMDANIFIKSLVLDDLYAVNARCVIGTPSSVASCRRTLLVAPLLFAALTLWSTIDRGPERNWNQILGSSERK